jgi:hypothetical protein
MCPHQRATTLPLTKGATVHKWTKLFLGGAIGALITTAAIPSAWAADDLVCVDISTTQVGCCLLGEDGKATKCFTITVN